MSKLEDLVTENISLDALKALKLDANYKYMIHGDYVAPGFEEMLADKALGLTRAGMITFTLTANLADASKLADGLPILERLAEAN